MESNLNLTSVTTGEQQFISDIKQIVLKAHGKVYSAINYAMVEQNWLIGQRIVEQEQHGRERADYGKFIIKRASEELTKEFGKGYSETNLRTFRRFFLNYNELPIQQTLSVKSNSSIQQTVSALLPWSHYERLMRVPDKNIRRWYEHEAYEQMWSYRTLDRNISTQYYERMLLSQVKEPVKTEMQEKHLHFSMISWSLSRTLLCWSFLVYLRKLRLSKKT